MHYLFNSEQKSLDASGEHEVILQALSAIFKRQLPRTHALKNIKKRRNEETKKRREFIGFHYH